MKEKIKKCFFIIIGMCFILGTVNAANLNVFGMTDAIGSKDEEVTIYISLNQELEFASADLVVEYDTSKLEYVKYTELDIFEKSAMNIVKNNTDTGKVAIGYVSNPDSSSLTKSPGQMLSITFKIISDKEETTELKLKTASLNKDSGEKIESSDITSKIKITRKENSSKENSSEENTKEKKDDTTSDAKDNGKNTLPKTGKGIKSISVILAIFIGFSCYFYKKYFYLRKI